MHPRSGGREPASDANTRTIPSRTVTSRTATETVMRPRRLPASLLAATTATLLGGPVHAQTAPPEARIKIDTDRTIGEVDPLLFGSFAEHLGRMIYGGIYEEGSPLSDERGFRTDVLEAVKGLGPSILRWPGGNFVSSYDWWDGIGPKDQRPVRAELAWHDLETNRFGTDEFLAYCEEIGAEPYIAVNLGLGTVDEARTWVEYVNESRPTEWAQRRRQNGRDEPWGVTYWGLGNEIDGWWQLGQKGPTEYAVMAREAAKAMRRVDPSIKLVASGSSNYGADWIAWNRTVLDTLRDQIDYIGIHTYINNRADDLEQFLGWSRTIEHYIDITAGLIADVRSGNPGARPIHIAYDEWNIWYRAFEDQDLEEVYNFEDALATGMFFNAFFRHADVVKMANLAQMVNVIAPIMTNEEGLFLQPTYFPFVEYGKQRGNTSLDVFVDSPTYTVGNDPRPLDYLYVSATHDADAGEVYVNVLNRSPDRDIATRVESQEGVPAAQVGVWEMNHPNLKATHTFGDDRKVRPVTRTASVDVRDAGFTWTFPAHSLTILRMRVE